LESLGQSCDMGVEWRHYKNVVTHDLMDIPQFIHPSRGGCLESRHNAIDSINFFVRSVSIPLVVHVYGPQGATCEWISDKLLPFKSYFRPEPALVEHLGRERDNAWGQPPRLRKKDATVRGDSRMGTKHVLER